MPVTVICVNSTGTVSTKPTVFRHVQVRMIQVDSSIDDRYNCARDRGTFVNSFCVDPPYSGGNDFDGSAASASAGLCCGSNLTICEYIVDTRVASQRDGFADFRPLHIQNEQGKRMLGRTISSLRASPLSGRADIPYASLLPACLLGCALDMS